MPHFTEEEVKEIRVTNQDFIDSLVAETAGQFQNTDPKLNIFGKTGTVNADDIQIKDDKTAWFLGTLKQYAKSNPKAIQDMIKDNGDGTVTVRFYKTLENGKKCPLNIKVDKSVPTNFDGLNNPDQPWIGLIEKAYVAGVNRTIVVKTMGNESIIKTGENIPNMQFLECPSPLTEVFSLFTPDKMVEGSSYLKLYDNNFNQIPEKEADVENFCTHNLKMMMPKNAIVMVEMNDGRILPVTKHDDEGIVIYDKLFDAERTYSYKNLLGTEQKGLFVNPNVELEDAKNDIKSIHITTPGTDEKRPMYDSLDIEVMQKTFSAMCKIAREKPIDDPQEEQEIKKLTKEAIQQFFVTSIDMIDQVYNEGHTTKEYMDQMKKRMLTSKQWQKNIDDVADSYQIGINSFHSLLHMEPTTWAKFTILNDINQFAADNRNKLDDEVDNSLENRNIDNAILSFTGVYEQDRGTEFLKNTEPKSYQYEDLSRKKEKSGDLYPDIQIKDDEPDKPVVKDNGPSLKVCTEAYELLKSYYQEMKKINSCLSYERDNYVNKKVEWKEKGEEGFDKKIYEKYKDIKMETFLDLFTFVDMELPEKNIYGELNEVAMETHYSQNNMQDFKKKLVLDLDSLKTKAEDIINEYKHVRTPLDHLAQGICDLYEQVLEKHMDTVKVTFQVAEEEPEEVKTDIIENKPDIAVKANGEIKPFENPEPNKAVKADGEIKPFENPEPNKAVKADGEIKPFENPEPNIAVKVHEEVKPSENPEPNNAVKADGDMKKILPKDVLARNKKIAEEYNKDMKTYDDAYRLLYGGAQCAYWNSGTYNDLVANMKKVAKYEEEGNKAEKEKYLSKAILNLEEYLKKRPEDLSALSNKKIRMAKLLFAKKVKNFLTKKLESEEKNYQYYAKGKAKLEVKENQKGGKNV